MTCHRLVPHGVYALASIRKSLQTFKPESTQLFVTDVRRNAMLTRTLPDVVTALFPDSPKRQSFKMAA
jgi:hypothetical protein